MQSIDMEYDLAIDGYSSVAEAENKVVRFVALYRGFNLENAQHWQEINSTIPKAIQSLYQQFKPW